MLKYHILIANTMRIRVFIADMLPDEKEEMTNAHSSQQGNYKHNHKIRKA